MREAGFYLVLEAIRDAEHGLREVRLVAGMASGLAGSAHEAGMLVADDGASHRPATPAEAILARRARR